LLTVSPKIDPIINNFYHDIVGKFWPPERKYVENGYENIPFPFHKLPSPSFRMSAKWSIKHLIGYIRTWSAVKRYRNNIGSDPLEFIEKELTRLWNIRSEFMDVYWPLSVLIGKKTAT
jgi:hypothetical protein